MAAATDATPEGPTTYQVTGMTCGHCAGNVTEAVSALPQVDLIAGGVSIVTVTGSVPLETVHRAIEETGYTVLS
nr:heavy-metal-associated domain-containing protein [Corynebacterium glutamicum]